MREHRLLALAVLLAVIVTTAFVLAFTIPQEESASTVEPHQAAVRADGGPEETGVATAVAGPPTESTSRPEESDVAAAISGR
jgi:hypothetical protein